MADLRTVPPARAETTTREVETAPAPERAPAVPEAPPRYVPDFTTEQERLRPVEISQGSALYRAVLPGILQVPADAVFALCRKSSLWPVTFGLACCAIEMMAMSCSRYDVARFGAEVLRGRPRQADLITVAGRLSRQMAPPPRRLHHPFISPHEGLKLYPSEARIGDSSQTTDFQFCPPHIIVMVLFATL